MIATYDIVAGFTLRRYRSTALARRYRCAAILWQTDHHLAAPVTPMHYAGVWYRVEQGRRRSI